MYILDSSIKSPFFGSKNGSSQKPPIFGFEEEFEGISGFLQKNKWFLSILVKIKVLVFCQKKLSFLVTFLDHFLVVIFGVNNQDFRSKWGPKSGKMTLFRVIFGPPFLGPFYCVFGIYVVFYILGVRIVVFSLCYFFKKTSDFSSV